MNRLDLNERERGEIELEQAYALVCATPSDIHQHLPMLRWLAANATDGIVADRHVPGYVVEFGVRSVVSTWALLAARPRRLLSVDIERHGNVDVCEAVVRDAHLSWTFWQRSTLEIDPLRECDFLFIDTLHTYTQLRAELDRHADGVRNWIAMHDTETFGDRGMDEQTPGLKTAINEFLETRTGQAWSIAAHFTHNNGLTVLRRRR